MAPHHEVWKRNRLSHHGGAIRPYLRSALPYGKTSPNYCSHCVQVRCYHDKTAPPPPSKAKKSLDLLDEIDLTFQRSNKKGE